MKTSLQLKIYFAMLVLAVSITASVFSYISWRFNQGYSVYYLQQAEDIKNHFAERLIKLYEEGEHTDWDFLRGNRDVWGPLVDEVATVIDPDYPEALNSYTSSHNVLTRNAPPPKRPHHPDHRPPHEDNAFGDFDVRLAETSMPTPPKPTPAVRYILLDVNKVFVSGPPYWSNRLEFEPLINKAGKTIAYHAIDTSTLQTNPYAIAFFEKNLWNLIIAMSFIVALALVLSIFLARHFLQPIRNLMQATDELVDGNYDAEMKITTRDELADLSHNFNKLSARLKQNEIARKQWIADISHELRTPISILRINLEALEDGITEPSPEAFALLQGRIKMLNKLVEDLHELSLSDIGKLSIDKETTNMLDILSMSAKSFEKECQDNNIELEFNSNHNEQFMMLADQRRISQVFNNIISNAIKYTDKPGKITISYYKTDNKLIIFFDDSAPGIDESEFTKIFDRLYRIENSRNRKTGGSGIGLAISQNIIMQHNGTIAAMHSPLGGLRIAIEFEEEQQA